MNTNDKEERNLVEEIRSASVNYFEGNKESVDLIASLTNKLVNLLRKKRGASDFDGKFNGKEQK